MRIALELTGRFLNAPAIDKREQAVSQQYKQLEEIKSSLDAKAADIEGAVTQRLTKERAAIIAIESKKAETHFSGQIDTARRRDQAQTARIAEIQKAELIYTVKRVRPSPKRSVSGIWTKHDS
jgi:hypothetical protein